MKDGDQAQHWILKDLGTKDTWDATRYYVYEVSSICVNRYYWIWCLQVPVRHSKKKKSWYAFKYLRNVKKTWHLYLKIERCEFYLRNHPVWHTDKDKKSSEELKITEKGLEKYNVETPLIFLRAKLLRS